MTVTPNKALNEPAHNSNVNSWDTPLNANFQNTDDWAGTVQAFNLASASGTVVASANSYAGSYPANTASYVPQLWVLTGTMTANVGLRVPSTVGGMWMIKNNTGGNYNVSFGMVGGGNTIAIAQGTNQIVWSNSSSGFVDYAQTSLTSISSDTQVIFNNSGALAGDANFTWSPQSGGTASSLGVTGNLTFTNGPVGAHNGGIVFPDATYQSTAAASLPAGVIMPYAGTSLPSGGWLWCNGAAVSQTTYANLFSAIGTTFNNSPGAGNFNLPDMRGNAPFGRDNMGGAGVTGRITNGVSGIPGTTLGAIGGNQEIAQHTHYLPTFTTSSGSSGIFGLQFPQTTALAGTGGSGSTLAKGTDATTGSNNPLAASTDSPPASANMPPAIIMNYIIKT